MSEVIVSKQVTIINPQGLHARPADLFARLASRFAAEIAVIRDQQRANGKSILDILMLAAVEGSVLTIEASGRDAVEAVEALALVLETSASVDQIAE